MTSIKSRLMSISLAVLVLFMILTAFALEQAVAKRMRIAEEETMRLHIYNLLAAVERDVTGSSIDVADERLFESRLFSTDSGLYAQFYNANGNEIWRSLSTAITFPHELQLEVDQWVFRQQAFEQDDYFQLAFGIQWPDVLNRLNRFDVVIWKNATAFNRQLLRFRHTLWSWLVVTLVLLIGVMYLVMVWSLKPLKKIGQDIKSIEEGNQHQFEGDYPTEIKPLTENLNALLNREQHQKQRYQNALDDLAHSLKTPLAVLRGITEAKKIDQTSLQTLDEQTSRMNEIVYYQLHKASAVGPESISKVVDLTELIQKLASALRKVYLQKEIEIDVNIQPGLNVRVDASDLMEVCGNLLDNACKYGNKNVQVYADFVDGKVKLKLDDDGKGMPADQVQDLLNRGVRLDQSHEGQGIGLAVVAEICKNYAIKIDFSQSPLGGLQVELMFPQ